MEVLKHEHPLCLVDMQPTYPEYEEEYDDETGDLVRKQNFRCLCDWCNKEISWFHRYYYKCADSCNYSLHKYCAELPLKFKYTSHSPHTLILFQWENRKWCCDICKSTRKGRMLSYHCSECEFDIHVNCGMSMSWLEDRIIYHPSHKHPLVATPKQITCECNACGEKHEGIFYVCFTCFSYFIHSDCSFMPEKTVIEQERHVQYDDNFMWGFEQVTDDIYVHPHPVTLSYSFPKTYQKASFDPPCRVCNRPFHDEKLWIYKCEKCRYYAHLVCVRLGKRPLTDTERYLWNLQFQSYAGRNTRFQKYYFNTYYSLPLPFTDETYSILKKQLFKESGKENFKMNIELSCHQHPLILVRSESIDITRPTSSSSRSTNLSLSCHDPMKEIRLLCNGCLRPITSFPFYKCSQHCNFVLHEWCTRLPTNVQDYMGHPHHTLTLHPRVSNKFFFVFVCDVCKLPCNGFAYSCVRCDYHIDVNCAFIPPQIKHKAHPNDPLQWNDENFSRSCILCLDKFSHKEIAYSCRLCYVSIHISCALLVPSKIRHKYDKHPMSLSYFPIVNHKSEYFCDVCEEEFNPNRCFYHCYQCKQSIHSSCAPLILQSEIATSSYHGRGVYEFLNIKFGGIHSIKSHPHDLSFVQGTITDNQCNECDATLQYKMIFKCQQCKFAVDLKCCEQLTT